MNNRERERERERECRRRKRGRQAGEREGGGANKENEALSLGRSVSSVSGICSISSPVHEVDQPEAKDDQFVRNETFDVNGITSLPDAIAGKRGDLHAIVVLIVMIMFKVGGMLGGSRAGRDDARPRMELTEDKVTTASSGGVQHEMSVRDEGDSEATVSSTSFDSGHDGAFIREQHGRLNGALSLWGFGVAIGGLGGCGGGQ